jgi:hypothetical protein
VDTLLESLQGELATILLLLLWCAWWLGCVSWEKAWPMLASGGWAPVLLLAGMISGMWAFLQPTPCTCLRIVTIPNGLWQLGEVGLLLALALLCGWLQGVLGWRPPAIPVEPPPVAHDHGHGHGHITVHH